MMLQDENLHLKKAEGVYTKFNVTRIKTKRLEDIPDNQLKL